VSIYLDSCVVIYVVEADDRFSAEVARAMREEVAARFCISDLDLVRLECLVGPLREKDDRVARYQAQFDKLRTLPMETEVFDLAARLRAEYGLKTPDALHAATAIHHGCEEIWTGDRRLPALPVASVSACSTQRSSPPERAVAL